VTLRDLQRRGRPGAAEAAPEPAATPGRADLGRRAVVLIFLAVTFLALARPLLGQGTFLAVDLLQVQPPWRAACGLLWLVPSRLGRGGRGRAAILRGRPGAAPGADRQ
jgi:hypothetical protein